MYRKDKPSTLVVRKFIEANRGAVYGMMLGDASIEPMGHDSRMRIRQSEAQKEYVLYKYELLQPVAAGKPYAERWSNGHVVWGFSTSTDSEWQRVWSVFHQNSPFEIRIAPNGKAVRYHRKVVTSQILRELDDHGLAFWIMDDGCLGVYQNKARRHKAKPFILSTDGCTLAENELIAAWFLERYGVRARISGNQYRLRDGSVKHSKRILICWTEYQKMIPRIERFIIPSMRYKIDPSCHHSVIATSRDKGRLSQGAETKTHSEHHGNVVNPPEMTGRPSDENAWVSIVE